MDGLSAPRCSTESSVIGDDETLTGSSVQKTDAPPFANKVELLTNSSGFGMLLAGVVCCLSQPD